MKGRCAVRVPVYGRKLFTSSQVASLVGVPQATLLYWVRVGRFAKPIRPGTQKGYWPRSVVEAELKRLYGDAAEGIIDGASSNGAGASSNSSNWASKGAAELFGGSNGAGEKADETRTPDDGRRGGG
jgi:hypothetical protein